MVTPRAATKSRPASASVSGRLQRRPIRWWSWHGNTSCAAGAPGATLAWVCIWTRTLRMTSSRICRWISRRVTVPRPVRNICWVISKTKRKTKNSENPEWKQRTSKWITSVVQKRNPTHGIWWWRMCLVTDQTRNPAYLSVDSSRAWVSIPPGFTAASSPSMPTAVMARWRVRL